MNKENTNQFGETLENLTVECFKTVRELCGESLPLIVAVTHAMSEFARVNNVDRIVGYIDNATKSKINEEQNNETH